MTPKEKQMLQELYEWMQERKRQAIPYPIDDTSLNTIVERLIFPSFVSLDGTNLTQGYVDNGGDSVTAPKAYAGSVNLSINGTTRRLPYL